jgi:glycosyltransferase involved in cell wall biosynthesis
MRPSVSAVICTRNRPRLLQQALDSVLDQKLRPAEVIIVDDGSDPPVDAPVESPIPIRIIRLRGEGPGAARAAGLEAVQEDLIAWCDDDDVWFPDHLEALVTYIEAERDVALVYGDAEWWEARTRGEVAYSLDYEARLLRLGNYILPSTALCRTDVARAAGGFDRALRSFEDWDLWVRLSLDHPLAHLARALGAVRWSEDGVWALRQDSSTHDLVYDRNQRLIARHGAAVANNLIHKSGPPPAFDPSTWCETCRELIWHSPLHLIDSFGVVARHLLAALERHGVQVRIAPSRDQPIRELERYYLPDDGRGRFGFYYDWIYQPAALPAPRIMYTMWESTRVPAEQVTTINRDVELLYVPSQGIRDIYLSCGVSVPVEVLHHGVSPDAFPVLTREEREVMTFGTFGVMQPRKGIDVLLSAFLAEFSSEEPARLLVNDTHGAYEYLPGDSRITWTAGPLDHAALLEFLRKIDVFVLSSRGEGWGLPGLEAMATGLPLIATNWSGPVEYMNEADSLPLDFELVDCDDVASDHFSYDGKWAEPDTEHLRALMRWCFEHRGEVRQMGLNAARRVRREFSWDRPAQTIRNDLDRLAANWRDAGQPWRGMASEGRM